jgi:predicted PurR-regulated permease PerM
MKQLAGYAAIVIATLAGLFVLWEFRSVVGVFFLSLVAAATVRPIIDRLTVRGVPQAAAMLLTYLAGLVLIAAVLYLFGNALMGEVERIANETAVTYESTRLRWMDGSDFEQALYARMPPPEELYSSITGEEGGVVVRGLFGVTRGLLSILGGLLLVLVLSIYWSADQNHFERLWLSLLPAERRVRARDIWRAVELGVGAYMRSELIQGSIGIFLLGFGYYALRLPYPILLALIGSLIWLIPIVGVFLALIPVIVVSLPLGLATTLLAAAFTLTVLLLLELAIDPRFFNRRRYSSLLIVLTMLPMAEVFGLVGLIFAPPIAAAIQIFFTTLYSPRTVQLAAEPMSQLGKLEQRLVHLRATVPANGEPASPEIESMMNRLESLLKKAKRVLPARLPDQGYASNQSRPLPK